MRIVLQVLSLLLLMGCQQAQEEEDSPSNRKSSKTQELLKRFDPNGYNVGFLLIDGVYNTEFTAPWDIFQHTIFRDQVKPMNVFSISNRSDYVTTFEYLKILPDLNFLEDSIPHIDILVVPSAEHNLDTDLEDSVLIQFVREIGANASWVTSHCDGAFVLAQAGLLDEVSSTTFPSDIDQYEKQFPHLRVERDVVFVHDDKFITSVGGARSFDGALYLTQILYGKQVADEIAAGLVIDWNVNAIRTIQDTSYQEGLTSLE